MFPRPRTLARIGTLTAGVALVLTAFASVSHARVEQLRWTHPSTDVVGFDALYRPLSGGSEQTVFVGLPTPDGNGVYAFDLEVGDGDVEISVRAHGPGGTLSGWTLPQLRVDGAAPPDPVVPPGAGTEIPPTAGATARFDFSGAETGWIDTAGGYSLNVDDGLFDVVSNQGNPMLHTATTPSGSHSHVTGADHIRANFELRGRMAVDHADAEIGITTYSQYPNTDTYYRISREGHGAFQLVGRPGLACVSADSGVVPAAGEWILFELDVTDQGDSNRIRAKLWSQGASEPSLPQIDCVDASSGRLEQGTFGVWAGGTGNKYWDDLELFQGVGSGGSTSPPPAPPTLLQVVPLDQ